VTTVLVSLVRTARVGAIAVSFLVLLRCAPAPAPRSAVPPSAPPGRVVLISFDGVSGERLERLLSDPAKLPAGGFRRLAERGFHAVRSHPPTPTLTAVSHITHVTGALPDDTGIVSNVLRDFTKPFPETISGFSAPIRAETLWEAARRQGKRVGVLLYPGADANGPARSADWMMTWPPDPLSPGRLRALKRSDWRDAPPDAAPPGDAPPRRVAIGFEETAHSFGLIAFDGASDGRVAYDRLLVVSAGGERREVPVDEWFPVEVPDADGRTGAWCRVLALAPDLSKAEVYVGPLARSTGTPREWVATLDHTLGFWPGTPDSDAFGAGSPRPELFLEQTERLADFLLRADLAAIARPDWDLLLIYRPEVDEVSHEFLLADPAQPRFTPERSARFLGFVERSYALVDLSLDRIEKALRANDSIFVTSDHGMTPLVAELSVNQILYDAGLVTLDEKGRISSTSPTIAVTSSGIAHVHLNPAAAPGTLDSAERAIRDYQLRGETLFDRIVRREDAGDLRLRAPESGDLIVLTKPGIATSSRVRRGDPVIAEPRNYGGHGYRNVYPDLDATFFSAGPGIPHGRVETIGSWQIAARVARALKIEPPRGAAAP
jgi:predicted AlkP superfamily pyrophosphatase or phosphodiesterase